MRPILYYAPGSASFLVHWLLIELDLEYELCLVDFRSAAQKSPAYLALNPNGVVPTLVFDGKPRHEAAALALLLAERHPQSRLAPTIEDPRRADYLQWMFNLANMVQPLFRQWWYPAEPAGEANAEAVHAHCAPRIATQWQRIDDHLGAHGPYLLGSDVSVADFYLTMLMRWSRNMAKPATEWPQLAALVRRMKARPSFSTLYEREGLTEWA
ncbi:MAG: glutathione S-transferase family protein [Thermomonas sp.]|uniref:glutathione S-transferase family protein n=1 Tax=Thermomonas sp. TaxID=1971895 RepID=UPI00262F3F2A|nr:glutathione S-transferase family protein [Thermomonas sp.]MCC7096721.1 glutathione S-transferase family protein [Thermomonas sp.]